MTSNPSDPSIDWCDSNTLIQDQEGKLSHAGTCIKISNNLLFLKSFTLDQLQEMKKAVLAAIDHEITKRTP